MHGGVGCITQARSRTCNYVLFAGSERFKLKHSSDKCVRVESWWGYQRLSVVSDCDSADLFQMLPSGALLHSSGMCVVPNSGGYQQIYNDMLVLRADCAVGDRIAFEWTENGSLRHRQTKACVWPYGGWDIPGDWTGLVLYPGCGEERIKLMPTFSEWFSGCLNACSFATTRTPRYSMDTCIIIILAVLSSCTPENCLARWLTITVREMPTSLHVGRSSLLSISKTFTVRQGVEFPGGDLYMVHIPGDPDVSAKCAGMCSLADKCVMYYVSFSGMCHLKEKMASTAAIWSQGLTGVPLGTCVGATSPAMNIQTIVCSP